MKKIFALLPIILFSLIGLAQPKVTRSTGSNTVMDTRGGFIKNQLTPVYPDTATASLPQNIGLDSCGAQIFTYDVMGIWVRACSPKRWVRVGSVTALASSNSILVSGVGSDADPYVPTIIVSPQNNNAVVSLPSGVFVPTQVQNGLIEGGILTWVSGYTYDVSPARYGIQNVVYNTLQDQITFAAADTLPRIDEAAVDINEDVVVIQGVASELPTQEPSYDPLTQVPLAFVAIDSNSTEPPDIKEEYIYRNNVEWTTSTSNVGRINPDATNNPYSVTKNIRFLLANNNDSIGFKAPTTPIWSDFTVITFKIFSNNTWGGNSSIQLQWYSGITPVGNAIFISNNVYGFISSNNGVFQTITIRLTDFNNISTADDLRIVVKTGSGQTISPDIDDIRLLGGDGVIVPQVGDDWHVGGNVLASTGRFGTLTPNNIDVITGNTLKATFNNTTSQFELFGNEWLRGANPGISFLSGTFAASDYYIRRVGTSIQTNTASSVQTFIGGIEAFRQNLATGNTWYDATGTQYMELDPSGKLAVGVNSSDTSAIFVTNSTTRGSLFAPRMTTAQKNAIVSPATGLTVFDTDLATFYYYNGSAWVPFGGFVTADNGLTANTATNVQLGGTLLANTTVNTGLFKMRFEGATAFGDSGVVVIRNTAARALYASAPNSITATFNGFSGIQAIATDGTAVIANATGTGFALSANAVSGDRVADFIMNASSTNTVVTAMQLLRQTTGTPTNGIGYSINYLLEATTTQDTSTMLISKLTDATFATRTSEFSITGINNGGSNTTLFTLSGSGATRLNKYGIGSFTAGTPAYGLAVDASGNIIESPVGGGIAAVTANNGLSVSSITNVQLGGSALIQNTSILTSTFSLTINSTNATGALIVDNGLASGSPDAIRASIAANAYGGAVHGIAVDGTGVWGESTNGSGGFFSSTNFAALYATSAVGSVTQYETFDPSTNSVSNILQIIRNTSGGAGTTGIGGKIQYTAKTSSQTRISNELISKWTTATDASRVSQFIITGVDNTVTADLFTISGSGQLRYNKYGINTFAGTPAYNLGVDASGNVIEVSAAGAGMTNVLTTTGDIIYSSSGSTPARLGIGTNGDVLTVVGGLPVWQSIGVGGSVSTVSWTGGIVSIANPTTAPAFTISGTSGGGVYFSSSSSWASTAVLGLNQLMIGGGAGAAYSTTTTGTGVLTALGINVGSAGAFVTFNGAGGTPSSITLTNGANLPLTGTTGTLGETRGGTNQTTYTTGQILYASASNTLSKLSIGITGQVLTVVGGLPVWTTPSTGGTVQDVTGTSNRITITGTATVNPVVDIASTYVGQTSITTLGTIATGAWNGTAIGATFGGTSFTTYTTGDLIYASATNTLSKRAIGSNGQVLTVSGGVPTWVTPGTGGSVTAFSFTNANGFTGTVANPNTTPALTLGTTLNGMLRGTGTGMAAVTSSTVGQSLLVTGANTFAFGALNLASANAVTGVLLPANGGTGVGSPFNAGDLLIGNGTGWTKAPLTAGTGIIITPGAGSVTISSDYARAWITVVESGTSINWNTTTGANARVTLSGTGRTLNIQNPIDGYTYTLRVIQGSGGAKTITTWTNVKWPNGGTLPTLSATAAQYDIFQFKYEASTGFFYGSVGLNYN